MMMIVMLFLLLCFIYFVWFAYANLKGYCPKGSKNSGFRSCIQGTKAYVKMRLGGCKKSSCKKGYHRKLKTKIGCTCVKPCLKGFKRRSNAAGSAFCDAKMPLVFNPFVKAK